MAKLWEEARRRAAKRVGQKRVEQHAEKGEQYVGDVKEGGRYYQEYKRPSLRNLAKMGPVVIQPEHYSRTFKAQVGASPELVRKIYDRLKKKQDREKHDDSTGWDDAAARKRRRKQKREWEGRMAGTDEGAATDTETETETETA